MSSDFVLTIKVGKESFLSDIDWPGLFLLTSWPSFTSISPLSKTKRGLESFGQMIQRKPLHPAMDGESRPFINPQTKTKEANIKRPLWTTLIARHRGKSAEGRIRSSLMKKTHTDCSCENKAKEI